MPKNTRKKILLIEDEEHIRTLYTKLLKDQNFEVVIAENGVEGLELIKKGGYDLVLLDIMMPLKDGFEILETVKKNNKINQPLQTIVLVTNLYQDQTIAKGTTYGVRGYMVKSDYNPEEFVKQIKSFLSA
jgi:two-component system, OmpR family, response regulator ResD